MIRLSGYLCGKYLQYESFRKQSSDNALQINRQGQ